MDSNSSSSGEEKPKDVATIPALAEVSTPSSTSNSSPEREAPTQASLEASVAKTASQKGNVVDEINLKFGKERVDKTDSDLPVNTMTQIIDNIGKDVGVNLHEDQAPNPPETPEESKPQLEVVNTNRDPKLVCLDFDKTLVNGHFHMDLANGGFRPGQEDTKTKIDALLDDPDKGLKNPEEMRAFIESNIKAGNKIAITSFTSYPEVVEPTLKRMGLSDEVISQIDQVAFLPSKEERYKSGKNLHIDIAMQNAKISDKSKVTLIDDDGSAFSNSKCNTLIIL